MDRCETLDALIQSVRHGTADFQAHAGVLGEILRATEDENIPLVRISQLVRTEPALTARVVAMASSTAFNISGGTIADLRMAIARIGIANVRSLALAILVHQLAWANACRNTTLAARTEQLWLHTAHVSALAFTLARRFPGMDADLAMFVGIIHDMAGLYILSRAGDFPGLLDDDGVPGWDDARVAERQVMLGSKLLLALQMPPAVMRVVEYYWDGYLAMPPQNVGDVLLLANDLAPVASPLHDYAIDRMVASADAAASIEMILGSETLSKILAESATEVAALVAVLQ